jgi:hypothetical protein
VRALAQLLPNFEGILIALVDLIELLHEVRLSVLGDPVVGAVVSGINDLLLLKPLDHITPARFIFN